MMPGRLVTARWTSPALLTLVALTAFACRSNAPAAQPSTSAPQISGFVYPLGVTKEQDPRFEWMLKPEHSFWLSLQTLGLSRKFVSEVKASECYQDILKTIETERNSGQFDFVNTGLVGNDYYYLADGTLWSDTTLAPVFDPFSLLDLEAASLGAWSASADGALLSVEVYDSGSEQGFVVILDRLTGELAAPVIPDVLGPGGHTWFGADKIAYRKASAAGLNAKDTSFGTTWDLYDLKSEETTPGIFGSTATGVDPDPSYWTSMWAATDSDWVVGTLWRGQHYKYLVASRHGILTGQPDWTEIDAGLRVDDVELLGGKLLLIGGKDSESTSLFGYDLQTHELSDLGNDLEGYIPEYSLNVGGLAYVFARTGSDYRVFGIAPDLAITSIPLPVDGVIDVDSARAAIAAGSGVTFTMSESTSVETIVTVQDYTAETVATASAAEGSILARSGLSHSLEFAESADGTMVPIDIVEPAHPAKKRTVSLLEVYGGYGSVTHASTRSDVNAWVSLGGSFAHCHVRGGGYYGQSWWLAGVSADRQRAMEDLTACADHLVSTGRSTRKGIAVTGASFGGNIAGPWAVLQKGQIGALVADYAVLNATRILDGPNGAAQIEEIGDPRDPVAVEGMKSIDAFETLNKTGAPVPTFLCIGVYDSRVPYWMSTRYHALVRDLDPDVPLGLFASEVGGHECGFSFEESVEAEAVKYTWLMQTLDAAPRSCRANPR